tara:strand:- start:891 stop:1310 length:420 start_codon:yes stop_codon:yes gene_type:complete
LIDNFSDKDKKDWEDFILGDEKLFDKDSKLVKKKNIETRSLDLHGYTLEHANKIVEKFISNAYSEGVNKLIIVTGKGLHSKTEKNPYVSKDLSILKYSVPEFILKNKELMKLIFEITDANVEDGGSGSFYIYLKKNRNK